MGVANKKGLRTRGLGNKSYEYDNFWFIWRHQKSFVVQMAVSIIQFIRDTFFSQTNPYLTLILKFQERKMELNQFLILRILEFVAQHFFTVQNCTWNIFRSGQRTFINRQYFQYCISVLRRLVAWIRSILLLKIQWWKRHYITEHRCGSVLDS